MRLVVFTLVAAATANQCKTLRDQRTRCRNINSDSACNEAVGCEWYDTQISEDGTVQSECDSSIHFEGIQKGDNDEDVADAKAYDYWDFRWRAAPSVDANRDDRWPNGFRRAVMHEHNHPPFCLDTVGTKDTEVKVMVESDYPNAKLCIVSQEYDELATGDPTALMKRCDFGQVTACFPANKESDLNLMVYCEDSCPEGETPFHYRVFHSDTRNTMDDATGLSSAGCTYRNLPCGYEVENNQYKLDEETKQKIPDGTYTVAHNSFCCGLGKEVGDASCAPQTLGAQCIDKVHKSQYCCKPWGFENAAEDVVDMWCMLLDGADTKVGQNDPESTINEKTAAKLKWPSELGEPIPKDRAVPGFELGNGAASMAPGVALAMAVVAVFLV